MTVISAEPGAALALGPSQEAALDRVAEWLKTAREPRWCNNPECLGLPEDADERPHTHGRAHDHPVLSIGGLAGTGKTALAGQLAGRLGKRVTFGTPTNKAAWVLRGKLPEEQRGRCGTYHSLLYRPESWHTCLTSHEIAQELECRCGNGFQSDECECPRFTCPPCLASGASSCKVESHLKFNRREHAGGHRDLLVLDEASMITESQVEEIRGFGLPVLLVGDHGQLAPVKGALSPWMLNPDVVLAENYRQAEESGIVRLALAARAAGTAALGGYGTGAVVISGTSRPDAYEALAPHRLPPGPDSAIITWTNSRRAEINRLIHGAIVPGQPIGAGDRVTALGTYECDVMKKTPYGWRAAGWQERVFNGLSGTVADVLSLGKKTADVVIQLDSRDGDHALRVAKRIDLGQLGAGRVLRPDERCAAAFDFSYCHTAHKSQGSEFSKVAVLGQGPSGADRARWLYTAITRARSKVLVII